MTDIKLADLGPGNRQVVAKAVHKELSPYIKSLARKYAERLGCEPSDIEGDAAVLILEELDGAIERSNLSVVAYLSRAIRNSLNYRLRKKQIQCDESEVSERADRRSYTIEREVEIADTLAYKLTDLEYTVCLSRIGGESWAQFLKANPGVSKQAYYDAIKSARDKLGARP